MDTLRRCRTRALDLLTEAATAPPPASPEPPGPEAPEPKPPEPNLPEPEPPTTPSQHDRGTTTGHRTVAAAEVGLVFTEIENAVREAGATRVEIVWKVYSGDADRTRPS